MIYFWFIIVSILVYFQLNDLKFSIIDKTINLSPKKLKNELNVILP